MNLPLLKQSGRAELADIDLLLTSNAYLTDETRLFQCLARDPVPHADVR